MVRTSNRKVAGQSPRKTASAQSPKSSLLQERKHANQHLPCPPVAELEADIAQGWLLSLTDKEVHKRIVEKLDTTKYGLSIKSFRKIRKELGYHRNRSLRLTVDDIAPILHKKRAAFPTAGYAELKKLLLQENELNIPRSLIVDYCHTYEPELIKQRLRRRLKRRRFWAAGVNDICAVDQHDKWQQFGLRMHVGMDPFSGRIHWLKVWHTNRNPKLIASYYLDFVESLQAMPLTTQSDPGTENVGIANAHTALRQLHDPRLAGTLQHRTMRDKKNVMPEIVWSQLRRRWAPGFEIIIQKGFAHDWCVLADSLDEMLFRWIFIPWIQDELDSFRDRINYNKKRHDRHKVRPQGPPHDIYFNPERYDTEDFRVHVSLGILAEIRELYAPPTDPVFLCVPSPFAEMATKFLQELHMGPVDRDNVWDIFKGVRECFVAFNAPLENPITWSGLLLAIRPSADGFDQLIPHIAVIPDYQPTTLDVNADEAIEEENADAQEIMAELTDEEADIIGGDWF